MKAKDLYNALLVGSSGGGVTPTGTIDITQNGTVDVTQYASADVDVPNTYEESDEGKVVSNGALVSQTSKNITENGTVDTTLNNEVVVSVQPNLTTKHITQNGTYTASSDNADGYSSVTVNTPAAPLEPGEVNFFDFDGTLLYVMTIAEARALQALPALPDHSQDEVPLSNGEWNYTLEELQSLQIPLDVGATYTVTDGKNHFIVDVPEDKKTVVVNFKTTVDWGDGTETTITGDSNKYHTYATSGRKHIILDAINSSIGGAIIRCVYTGLTSCINKFYGVEYVKEMYFGNIGESYFGNSYFQWYKPDVILLPKTITTLPTFSGCRLKYMTIPRACTYLVASLMSPPFTNGIIKRVSIPPVTGKYIFFPAERVSAIIGQTTDSQLQFLGHQNTTTDYVLEREVYFQTAYTITFQARYTGYNIKKIHLIGPFKLGQYLQVGNRTEDFYAPNAGGYIASYALQNTLSLHRMVAGNILTLETYALYGSGITELDLPATLYSIESDALYDTQLNKLICRATTPPTLVSAFNYPPGAVYVPDAAVADYQAATNWSSCNILPLSDIEP